MPPLSAEANANRSLAMYIVDTVAEEAWNYTPPVQEARAKDIAHRNMRHTAQNDPDTVMAVLLRDPDTLVHEAQEIMHHEWEVAKTAPSAISPFSGKAHRLEPAEATQPTQPNSATQPKAAPLPPPPSWSASAQRQRREAKAAAHGANHSCLYNDHCAGRRRSHSCAADKLRNCCSGEAQRAHGRYL